MAYVQPYGDPSAHGNLHNSLQFRRSKKGVILQTHFKSKPKYKGMNPVQTQKLIDGNNTWKTSPYETKHFFRQDGINKSKTGKELFMSRYLKDNLPSITPQTKIKKITYAGLMTPQGEEIDEITLDFQFKESGSEDFISYGKLKDNENLFIPDQEATNPANLSLLIYEKKADSSADCTLWTKLQEELAGVIPSEIGPGGTPDYTPVFLPGKWGNGLAAVPYNNNIIFYLADINLNKGIISLYVFLHDENVNVFNFSVGNVEITVWTDGGVGNKIYVDFYDDPNDCFYEFSKTGYTKNSWTNIIIRYNTDEGAGKRIELYYQGIKWGAAVHIDGTWNAPLSGNLILTNIWNYLTPADLDNIKFFDYDKPIEEVINNRNTEGFAGGGGTRTIAMPWKYELRIKWIDFLDVEKGATIRLNNFTIEPETNYRFYISTDWSTYRDPAYWKLCIAGV